MDEQQITETSFLDTLPEDLRGEASLADFKDVGGLAKSYINAQRMLGSSVRIPGEDANDEVRSEFYNKLESVPGVMKAPDWDDPESVGSLYNKLGRPETADSYSLTLPEGAEVNKEQIEEFNKYAHDLGLTQKQYEGVMSKFIDIETNYVQELEQGREAGKAKLQELWGSEYDNKLNAARNVAEVYREKYGEFADELINGPAGNNPALLSMMAELASTFQEKGTISGQRNNAFGMTPEEAQEKIDEIYGNIKHPFWQPQDPEHEAAKKRVNKLFSVANAK